MMLSHVRNLLEVYFVSVHHWSGVEVFYSEMVHRRGVAQNFYSGGPIIGTWCRHFLFWDDSLPSLNGEHTDCDFTRFRKAQLE